ncbi:MAG: MBL fold metallo-hydrolase [Ichthyobacteriaceae bacterium]|nr:MBL fold metallo-hydrolase [Ichthyobacteriaceae bacterium]
MKIYSIETQSFMLDGGAMFGVVPKVLWSKNYASDENNRIKMAARSLLIQDNDKLILIDAGMGDKQSDKFWSHYYLWGNNTLKKSLHQIGFTTNDITDVLLTHLHFDHVGGCVEYNADKTELVPTFKNATYWTNKEQWKWATEPNVREKASFLSDNILPLKQSNQLKFIDFKGEVLLKNSPLGFDILRTDGHTDAQMIPMINYKGKKIVFMADFLPTTAHIPLPYVMSYDTRPLLTMNEKNTFLNEAANNNYYLFLQHDAYHSVCTVKNTDKGVKLNEALQFNDVF